MVRREASSILLVCGSHTAIYILTLREGQGAVLTFGYNATGTGRTVGVISTAA